VREARKEGKGGRKRKEEGCRSDRKLVEHQARWPENFGTPLEGRPIVKVVRKKGKS